MTNKGLFFACLLAITFNVKGASAMISMPDKGWHVNNFKQEATGADVSFEKAPDNSNAIKIKFYGKRGANVVMGRKYLDEQYRTWPAQFTGLSGYFWNNGSINIASIVFRTGDGKESKFQQFNARIALKHKGWKIINIPTVTNYQNKNLKLKPNDIRTLFINTYTPGAEFAIASLYWQKPGIPLLKSDFGKSSNIYKAITAPVIDGNINDSVWNSVPEMPLNNLAHNQSGRPSNKSWVKVAYDEQYFYIAGRFSFKPGASLKANLKEHDSSLWEDEDVEFFLYPGSDPRMYYQFMINPNGAKAELAKIFDQVEDRIVYKFKDWNGDWQGRATVATDHWTIEAAVPWKTIGSQSVPPLIQFQVMRCDRSLEKPQYPVWSYVQRRAVEGFGLLNPLPCKQAGVAIYNVLLKRLKNDRINVTCAINAQKALGKAAIELCYSAPGAASKKFRRNIETNDTHFHLNWDIDIGLPVNGFHQVALKVVPEGKSLNGACTIYDFIQTIPSRYNFSDIVFNPIPKVVKRKNGEFQLTENDVITIPIDASKRTIKTAEYLADKLYGFYGIKPPVKPGEQGRISLKLAPAELQSKADTDWHEAYTLDVAADKIAITGAGEAGLYYGVVTLKQLASAPKQPNVPIQAMSIIDWPSYKKRIVTTYTMFHFKKDFSDGKGGLNIDKLKKWMENYLAGNKYNMLCLSWGDQVNYPSVPKLHHPKNFTPQEIRELYDFGREHFLNPFPGMLYGAHAPAITRHFPELIEKKWGTQQMDITKPEVFQLMNKLFNDLIEIAGPGSQYFMTFNDEWWHSSRGSEDVVYNGKTRQELFLNFLMKEYALLKKHNLKMVMYNDQLLPTHGGGAPFNLADIVPSLPLDIVMATWSNSNKYFADKGFTELWRIDNGFVSDSRKPFKGNSGFGQLNYHTNTLFNQTNQTRTLHYGFHTEFQTANYGWNKNEKGSMPMFEWTMQLMPSLMGMYSMQANPYAGDKLTKIAVKTTLQLPLKNEDSVGDIPMLLGATRIYPDSKYTLSLKPNTKLASLYILNNIVPEDKATVKKLHKRFSKEPAARPYGLIVGYYQLNYEDGSRFRMPLRLGRNIALFKYTPAQSRYIRNCRAVYPLKDDFSIALNQFEWVNPHPEKAVTSLTIESEYKDAPILLSAITLRSTKKLADSGLEAE